MTKVCVLETLARQNHTLVQVQIHSGRPRQTGIHLAYIRHPLVGDPLWYCLGFVSCWTLAYRIAVCAPLLIAINCLLVLLLCCSEIYKRNALNALLGCAMAAVLQAAAAKQQTRLYSN